VQQGIVVAEDRTEGVVLFQNGGLLPEPDAVASLEPEVFELRGHREGQKRDQDGDPPAVTDDAVDKTVEFHRVPLEVISEFQADALEASEQAEGRQRVLR